MASKSHKFSGRVLGAIVGVAALSLLAMACAPPGGGPAAPTTTTSTTLPWSPPTGQWFGVNMTCYFNVFGSYYNFAQYATVNIEAPATVNAGEDFDITVTPGTFVVPTVVEGYAVENLKWMTIRYPLPNNVQFVDSVMSAGIDMGPGYPSLSIEGGFMVYRVPGPFVPGSTVQMPKDRLTFTATGVPGSTVETRMHTLSNVAQFDLASVSNTCHPDDSDRVFTTTVIT